MVPIPPTGCHGSGSVTRQTGLVHEPHGRSTAKLVLHFAGLLGSGCAIELFRVRVGDSVYRRSTSEGTTAQRFLNQCSTYSVRPRRRLCEKRILSGIPVGSGHDTEATRTAGIVRHGGTAVFYLRYRQLHETAMGLPNLAIVFQASGARQSRSASGSYSATCAAPRTGGKLMGPSWRRESSVAAGLT